MLALIGTIEWDESETAEYCISYMVGNWRFMQFKRVGMRGELVELGSRLNS